MAATPDLSNVRLVSDIDGVYTHLERHIDRSLPAAIKNSRRATDVVRSVVSTYVEFFGIGKKAVERRFAISKRMDWSLEMINAHRLAEKGGLPFMMALTSNGHSQLIKEQLEEHGLSRLDALHSGTLRKMPEVRRSGATNPKDEIMYLDDNVWQAVLFRIYGTVGFFKGRDNIHFVLVEAEHNKLAVRLASRILKIRVVKREERALIGEMVKVAQRRS